MPGDARVARAVPAGDAADEHCRDDRARAERGDQQARVEGVAAAHDLHVQRHQDQRAEHRDRVAEEDAHRGGERPVGEQTQVDQRAVGPPQGVAGERREQDDTVDQADQHPRLAGCAALAGLGQAVDQRGQPGGEHDQPQDVQAGVRLPAGVGGQQANGEEQGGRADRHVDEEHPAPRQVLQQQPAEDRAERRRQHRGDGHHGHRPCHPLGTRLPGEHRLPHRHEQAAADALQHPEGDEAAGRPGGAAQHRAGDEQDQRGDPDRPGAEALHRPAGDRNRHGQRQRDTRSVPTGSCSARCRGPGRARAPRR